MTREALFRRFQNPSPGAIAALLLVAGGVGYWYFTKDAKAKEKGKKLPSSTPVPGTVQLLPKIPGYRPDPPFVLLAYRDNAEGQAALKDFQDVGKSVKVPLYATTYATYETELGDLPGNSLLVAQRMNGSWLETLEGEDQAEYIDTTPEQTRVVMDWAISDSYLPIVGAIWKGDADALWKPIAMPPLPIDLEVGTIYRFPVPTTRPVDIYVTSSNDNAVGVLLLQDDEDMWTVQVIPKKQKPGVILTLNDSDGDWKRQILVHPQESSS